MPVAAGPEILDLDIHLIPEWAGEPAHEHHDIRFLLRVSISRGWPIPSDSIARVTSSNFLGAKTIDIARGLSSEPLQPGARIKAAPPIDMFSAFSSVAEEMDLPANTVRVYKKRVTATLCKEIRRLNHELG